MHTQQVAYNFKVSHLVPFFCHTGTHSTLLGGPCSVFPLQERLVPHPHPPSHSILTNISWSGALSPRVVNQPCIWKTMPNAPNYSCIHNPKTYPNSAAKLGIDSSSLVSWFLAVFFFFHSLHRHYMKSKCLLDQVTTSLEYFGVLLYRNKKPCTQI